MSSFNALSCSSDALTTGAKRVKCCRNRCVFTAESRLWSYANSASECEISPDKRREKRVRGGWCSPAPRNEGKKRKERELRSPARVWWAWPRRRGLPARVNTWFRVCLPALSLCVCEGLRLLRLLLGLWASSSLR